MKNLLVGVGIFALLVLTMSFNNVKNQMTEKEYFQPITEIPLKQKSVFVANDLNIANRYIRKGYVLQDVDVFYDDRTRKTYKYYTLIKY